MTFFPVVLKSFDRRRKGLTPGRLVNVMLEKVEDPISARRTPLAIVSRPGLVEKTTLGGLCRGLYAEEGVQGAALFAAAGQSLHTLSDDYAASLLGALAGAEPVTFDALRDDLVMRAGGELKIYNGALTKVTDVDAPSAPSTLCTCALRGIAAEAAGDGFGWSLAGNFTSWPVDGFADDIYAPDPIVAQARSGDDFISFNARSLQRWRPTGGAEAEAFAPIIGASVDVGLLGRECWARANGEIYFVSHQFIPHRIGSGAPAELANETLSDALGALSPSQRASALAFPMEYGAALRHVGVTAPGLDRAFVFDARFDLWAEWTRYGKPQFDLGFATRAYGAVHLSGPYTDKLYALDAAAFSDAGDPIVRVITFHIPFGEDAAIDSLALDLQCHGQPLSGQGSSPTAMVRVSRNGGRTFEGAQEVELPPAGEFEQAPTLWGLGLFSRQHGAVIELSISDPIGFSLRGAWVNDGMGADGAQTAA